MPNTLTHLPALNTTIVNHKVLSVDEEIELIKDAQKGNEEARHKIITHNLRFVVSERNKILDIRSTDQSTLDECFSLGIVALHKAIDHFKLPSNARFVTYAKWWIKSLVIKYLAEDGTIKIPQSSMSKLRRAQKDMEDHNVEFNSRNLMMGKCDAYLKEHGANRKMALAFLRTKAANNTSLQQNIFDDSTERSDVAVAEETFEPPQCDDDLIIRQQIDIMLCELTDRESVIITLRYGLHGGPPRTLDRISKIVSLTRERVRQIQKSALTKLRKLNIAQKLY